MSKDIIWMTSPLTLLDYRSDLPSDYVEVKTVDDLHINILNKLKDRIRYLPEGFNKRKIVPVVFYNENDRIKSMKKSPFVIVKPTKPRMVEDQVDVDIVKRRHENEVDWYINNSAVMYDFEYTLTVVADNYTLFSRLQLFIKDYLFPQIRGSRSIVVSIEDGISNTRPLKIIGENAQEDFENNYFQYDIDLEFRLGLFIKEWQKEFGIINFEIEVERDSRLITKIK